MNRKMKRAIAGAACAASAIAMTGAGTMNETAEPKADIGVAAPGIVLFDTEGNEHTLSQYIEAGNTVVLEWFNPTCPFVKKHYREDTMTMVNLQKEFAEEDIVWLRINSAHEGNPSSDIELNKSTAKDWGITTPILMDPTGEVGRAYGAKRTPEMYIINNEGILVYHGAIDNVSNAANPGDVNFVHGAITETLAGTAVTKPQTKPYGCSVKYD